MIINFIQVQFHKSSQFLIRETQWPHTDYQGKKDKLDFIG